MVNLKHSVNVEAQVKALQEEAAAENDHIDRAMQALGMRQHAEKWKTSCALSEKEARAVSAYLTQKGALTGSTLEASPCLGTRLTRTGTFSYERGSEIAGDARWNGFSSENTGSRGPLFGNAVPFSKELCKALPCQVSRQRQVSGGRSRLGE